MISEALPVASTENKKCVNRVYPCSCRQNLALGRKNDSDCKLFDGWDSSNRCGGSYVVDGAFVILPNVDDVDISFLNTNFCQAAGRTMNVCPGRKSDHIIEL